MSVHATLLIGWSGTLAFLAAWFGLLARLRPEDRAFARFSLFALANAVGLFATASLLTASSLPVAATERSLQLACFGVSAYLIPGLVEDLVPGKPSHGGPARWLAPPFTILAASGALVDPLLPAAGVQASLTPLGLAVGSVVALTAAPPLAVLVREARSAPGLRAIVGALVVGLIGGMGDLVRLGAGLAALEVASHATGAVSLAIGAVLMRRVVAGEDELVRRSAQLSTSLRELRAAESALVETQSRAALGELAAVIAHEVRNPLAVLRNAASSLRKPTTSSIDVETLVEIVKEETRRLDQLGKSLSHFAEPTPYRPERVAVGPLLRDVVAAVRRAHDGARGVSFEVADASEHAVIADPELLRQALINVVDNGVRALPAGGQVAISLDEVGSLLRVTVRDDGEGMSPGVLSRARDPFFTTRATGTGLGLALVDKVVRLHGGELAIAAGEPRGTAVSITLRRA